jgi:hypothetical protein
MLPRPIAPYSPARFSVSKLRLDAIASTTMTAMPGV